jgi:hypothetical protein
MFLVLSGKIAKRSGREQAFVTRSEWQQRSWENKSFPRITRLHWNIFQQFRSSTAIILLQLSQNDITHLLSSNNFWFQQGKLQKTTRCNSCWTQKSGWALEFFCKGRLVWYKCIFSSLYFFRGKSIWNCSMYRMIEWLTPRILLFHIEISRRFTFTSDSH